MKQVQFSYKQLYRNVIIQLKSVDSVQFHYNVDLSIMKQIWFSYKTSLQKTIVFIIQLN